MCMSFRTYRSDVHPFETDTKGRLFVVDVSINWPSKHNKDWRTKKTGKKTSDTETEINGKRKYFKTPPTGMNTTHSPSAPKR